MVSKARCECCRVLPVQHELVIAIHDYPSQIPSLYEVELCGVCADGYSRVYQVAMRKSDAERAAG